MLVGEALEGVLFVPAGALRVEPRGDVVGPAVSQIPQTLSTTAVLRDNARSTHTLQLNGEIGFGVRGSADVLRN